MKDYNQQEPFCNYQITSLALFSLFELRPIVFPRRFTRRVRYRIWKDRGRENFYKKDLGKELNYDEKVLWRFAFVTLKVLGKSGLKWRKNKNANGAGLGNLLINKNLHTAHNHHIQNKSRLDVTCDRN